MNEHTPDHNMSPDEYTLDQDLRTGDGAECIDNLETFLAAKESLILHLKEAMEGTAVSEEASGQYIEAMLIETSQQFATTVMAVTDRHEMYRYAAELLDSSLKEFRELMATYETGASVNIVSLDEMIQSIESSLEETEQDNDDIFTTLEQSYGGLHQTIISSMLEHAKENKNDARRAKVDKAKKAFLEVARDSVKIAIGATAAIIVMRYWDKK